MIVYNSLFFTLILSVILFHKNNKLSDSIFWVLSLMVILVPALRDISVGTDTINYARYFENPEGGYDNRDVEAIYAFWNGLIAQIWNNTNFYFFLSAFVSIGCVVFFIKNNSPHKIMSLLTFVLITEFYFMYFSAMRQILAMGFFVVSLHFYNQAYTAEIKRNTNYIKALLFFIIAVSFHTTAAYCLIVVLIFSKIEITKKMAYVLLISSFFVGLFNLFQYRAVIAFVFNFLDGGGSILDRYDVYSEAMDWNVTTYRRVANMLPLTLICLYLYYKADKEDLKYLFLKLFMFGMVLSNILISYPIGGRLVMYLTMLIIVVFPLILYKKKKAYLFMSCCIILYFLYKANSSLLSQAYSDGNIVVFYKTFLLK